LGCYIEHEDLFSGYDIFLAVSACETDNRVGDKASMFKNQPSRRICFAMPLLALLPSTGIAQSKPIRMVVLGDSLTAGYNLPASAAFPSVLQRVLRSKGISVEIENAGVSGDTASAGRDRLDWSIGEGADIVLVSLGANDSLRGVDAMITRKALDEIITRLHARKIKVLLAGILAPPNNGPVYGAAFKAMYEGLAAKHNVPLYPFFLDGVAGNPKLNLSDQLHPNAEGVEEMVRRILPFVEVGLKLVVPSK
jgi:acyl-CoA thioesterase I